jgi:hypothetical protein
MNMYDPTVDYVEHGVKGVLAMKRSVQIAASAIALSLLLVAVGFAQGGPGKGLKWTGSGGWGMGSPYQRLYNPSTVETVAGTVESVSSITPARGMSYGVHLLLKTDKETVSVHLGPAWYIERLDTGIERGDKMEVRGSRITFDGKPAIIAAEIKKDNKTLVLRDSSGVPVWAGWRR